MRHLARRSIALGCLAACCAAGCAALHTRHAEPANWRLVSFSPHEAAATELQRAKALEAAGDDGCVDACYLACSLLWPEVSHSPQAVECYNAAVERLLRTGLRFGRLDPASSLVIRDGGQTVRIPVVHLGFPWQPADFQRL